MDKKEKKDKMLLSSLTDDFMVSIASSITSAWMATISD